VDSGEGGNALPVCRAPGELVDDGDSGKLQPTGPMRENFENRAKVVPKAVAQAIGLQGQTPFLGEL
jgi:hypothetical protein